MNWFIYRDTSLAIWGEYISLDSWSGYKKLSDALSYKINIRGRHKTNSYGLKPFHWQSRLEYNGYWFDVPTTHPSCKSIKDACDQANKALTDGILKDACHFFLSKKFAYSIVNKDCQPYFTSFGPPQWANSHRILYPCGQYYYAYRFKNKIKFGQTNVTSYGYGSSGTEIEFEHWL